MLHFHKTLAIVILSDKLGTKDGRKMKRIGDRWPTASIHHTLTPRNHLETTEFSLSYITTVPLFWLAQDGWASQLLWHGKGADPCQGSIVMGGKRLDQAQQRGFHSGPCWGPRGYWLSWGSLHRLRSPHPTHLPFLTSAVCTLLSPQPEAGHTVTPELRVTGQDPHMDRAEYNTSFPTSAADS